MIEKRKAKPDEFIINVKTGEIEYAHFVESDGAAVINISMSLFSFSDSPTFELLKQEDYLVLGDSLDPTFIINVTSGLFEVLKLSIKEEGNLIPIHNNI
jgi:hypothetical protein